MGKGCQFLSRILGWSCQKVFHLLCTYFWVQKMFTCVDFYDPHWVLAYKCSKYIFKCRNRMFLAIFILPQTDVAAFSQSTLSSRYPVYHCWWRWWTSKTAAGKEWVCQPHIKNKDCKSQFSYRKVFHGVYFMLDWVQFKCSIVISLSQGTVDAVNPGLYVKSKNCKSQFTPRKVFPDVYFMLDWVQFKCPPVNSLSPGNQGYHEFFLFSME